MAKTRFAVAASTEDAHLLSEHKKWLSVKEVPGITTPAGEGIYSLTVRQSPTNAALGKLINMPPNAFRKALLHSHFSEAFPVHLPENQPTEHAAIQLDLNQLTPTDLLALGSLLVGPYEQPVLEQDILNRFGPNGLSILWYLRRNDVDENQLKAIAKGSMDIPQQGLSRTGEIINEVVLTKMRQRNRSTIKTPEGVPGRDNAAYKKRRDDLARLTQDWKPGDPIPHIDYTEEENEIWRSVWELLRPAHDQFAIPELAELFDAFGLDINRIPQLSELNDRLFELTGFKMIPVAGLLSARKFLLHLKDREFPSTNYIRQTRDYTPEPDIVHESLHALMLGNKNIAELSQLFGEATQVSVLDDWEIQQLERIFWYTIEFGAVHQDGKIKSYGAGDLSSFGELGQINRRDNKGALITDFVPDAMGRQPYDFRVMQPVLFVARSFDEMHQILKNYLVEWIDERKKRQVYHLSSGIQVRGIHSNVLFEAAKPGENEKPVFVPFSGKVQVIAKDQLPQEENALSVIFGKEITTSKSLDQLTKKEWKRLGFSKEKTGQLHLQSGYVLEGTIKKGSLKKGQPIRFRELSLTKDGQTLHRAKNHSILGALGQRMAPTRMFKI